MKSKDTASKKGQDILKTASPKKKALLVCKQWTDRQTRALEPLLTENEVKAIRESLKTDKEKRDYNKWIDVYNVYVNITPMFGLVYKEYQSVAERILGYLRQWEDYNQEENHLNTIYEALLETGEEAALDAFASALPPLLFVDAKLLRNEEGYVEIDVGRLYRKVRDSVEELEERYKEAKALVVVTEEYTRLTHSSDFRPDIMVDAIKIIKEDYALRVAPRYSRKRLQEKIDGGQRVTSAERLRAIFPYYEEIEEPKDIVEFWKARFNELTGGKVW